MTIIEKKRPITIQKKKTIVETAYKVFKENGFYASGVDLIMSEAGISKRTLYKYFRTKNELIFAVLEYYQSIYQLRIEHLLEDGNFTAKEKILLIFDDANTWFDNINFHGCLAVNAMAEFSGKDASIEEACMRFKRWELDLLTNLTKQVDAVNSDELAYKLFVLLEGMSSIAQVHKGSCPIDMTVMVSKMIESDLA